MNQHQTPNAISALTEPSYLPAPNQRYAIVGSGADRSAAHYVRQPMPITFLANLCAIVHYIAQRTSEAIPSVYGTDPNRACITWQTFYRQALYGTLDQRTYAKVLDSLTIGNADGAPILTTDEYERAALVVIEPDAELDGNANSPAPRVLTTTVGHKATNAGEFRTFRRHMPIVDSLGNLSDAHSLKVRADNMLSVSIHATDDVAWRLIGAQDVVATESAVKGTGSYKASIYGGHELAKSTPCAKQPAVKYPSKRETHSVALWGTLTARYELLTTTYNGTRCVGHGRWVPTTSGTKPTTTKGRKAKTARRTAMVLDVDRANAPRTIADASRTLTDGQRTKYNVRNVQSVEALTNAESTPPAPVLVEITVGRRHGKGYDVVIQRADDKASRVRTTVTTPDRVAAVIGNRLAQIG